ncbi:unnamed protein product [Citrullus colocynthis]|uniref:Uncharacterized protein n=1 Tax=Citrullus colocynthis TaxID=252529 RepID=A0ABP0Y925_9ROSI
MRVPEVPPVDVLVTTADWKLEPPIMVVNTVLSWLAVDYPMGKLTCYVSDDGRSPILFYALVEASNFAKIWVPFCKKYNIQVRAPFRYFAGESPSVDGHEFRREEKRIKDEYERPCERMKTRKRTQWYMSLSEYYEAFRNTDNKNHPTIIKVLLESKGNDSNGIPNLVYVAREKRPNRLPITTKQTLLRGMAGIQGPLFGGCNCFHRRKTFYTLNCSQNKKGKFEENFGESEELTKSTDEILGGLQSNGGTQTINLSSSIQSAYQVASSDYENNTAWGLKVQERATLAIFVPIFILYRSHSIFVYLQCGLSIRAWWNSVKMEMVSITSSYAFGILSLCFVLKLFGMSESVFEVTPKGESNVDVNEDDCNVEKFAFNESPLFIIGTAVVLLHLMALASKLVWMQPLSSDDGRRGSGIGEILGCVWVLFTLLPDHM